MRRRTIASPITVRGIGLVSQRPVSVCLKPANDCSGIVFNDRIPATVNHASVSAHRTCVGRGRHKIHQVEHLMAACAGLGVTDLAVEVKGNELPFGDGSSLLFFRALKQAGIVRLNREVFPVRAGTCTVRVGDSSVRTTPHRTLVVCCTGRGPGYGLFDIRLRVTEKSFESDLAGARTFGPLPGSLLRFSRRFRLTYRLRRRAGWAYPATERMPQEPGRHKILDLLGDLWLLGRPLFARISACLPNHRLNLALVRELEAH